MSYIDWNVAKQTKRGNNTALQKDARLFYRDGTGEKKTNSYTISLYEGNVQDEVILADAFCIGSDGDNIYITTKDKSDAPKFTINPPSKSGGRTYKVNGKDMIIKIIKTLTGITPKGDLTAEFNLKEVGEQVYKIVEFKVI